MKQPHFFRQLRFEKNGLMTATLATIGRQATTKIIPVAPRVMAVTGQEPASAVALAKRKLSKIQVIIGWRAGSRSPGRLSMSQGVAEMSASAAVTHQSSKCNQDMEVGDNVR